MGQSTVALIVVLRGVESGRINGFPSSSVLSLSKAFQGSTSPAFDLVN